MGSRGAQKCRGGAPSTSVGVLVRLYSYDLMVNQGGVGNNQVQICGCLLYVNLKEPSYIYYCTMTFQLLTTLHSRKGGTEGVGCTI